MGEVLNIWRWGISRTTGLPSLATHQARMGMETIKEAGAYQYQGPLHRLCLVVLSAYQRQEINSAKVVTDLTV